MHKLSRSKQESSKQCDVQNLPGRCAAVFWAVGPYTMLAQVAQLVDTPLATTSKPRRPLGYKLSSRHLESLGSFGQG